MTFKGIDCKLIKRNGDKAEVEIDGQKVIINHDNIPTTVSEGSNCQLYFLDAKESNIQEKKIAKSILEEILNGK